MIADAARLELAYRYSAAAYWFIERRCHDDITTARAKQRDITRWSFEVVRGVRPDVQAFTNLLIQFPQDGTGEPGQVAPDNVVFVHPRPLKPGDGFNPVLQPAKPFLALDYRKPRSYDEYEKEFEVPYYLLFDPDADELTLFRLREASCSTVRPNANGRYAIPELELEVALLGGWVRYWFRGELVPLPGDLLRERDAARQQLDAERAGRLAAEAELAKLRDELAKAKGGG